MNSLIKSSALAAMLSLAMTTTAGAKQPEQHTSSDQPADQNLVAQVREPFRDSRPIRNFLARRYLDEMIMSRIRMVDAAQEALQAPDTNAEIRKMAEETIRTSNAEIMRMVEMRQRMFQDSAR